MIFENILVPVDLSNYSTRSFKMALNIAKKFNSKITLLSCLEERASYHLYYQSGLSNEQREKQNKAVKKYFKNLEQLAEKNDVSIKTKILISHSIVKTITSFAKSQKYDLIVIGSHGRTGFDKLLLGSVASGVSQKSPCPILITK